jgi:hypothetical protein
MNFISFSVSYADDQPRKSASRLHISELKLTLVISTLMLYPILSFQSRLYVKYQ